MSGFVRAQVSDKLGKARDSRAGDGMLSAVRISTNAAAAADTMLATHIAGGIYQRTGMSANRTDATDTAANFLSLFSNMDVGDNFLFLISVGVAYSLTLSAGTGVTLAGKTVVAASASGWFLLEKTSSTTVTITGL